MNSGVSIVTLTHIKDTRDTTDFADVHVVETEFTTSQCQYYSIIWSLFNEFSVVVTANFSTVTTTYQEEVFNSASFYSVDYFISNTQYCAMTETSSYFMTTVDTSEFLSFFVAAQFDSTVDNGGEVFSTIFFFFDMCTTIETYHICSEDISFVVFFWWHNAVCSEQECTRNINKFFLLVLPCCTEVTFQLRMFLQFRISVARQHFTMSIDIYTFTVSLFQ